MTTRQITHLLTLSSALLASSGLTASAETFAEALDTTGLVWTTGGNNNWFATNASVTPTFDGVDAAASGTIGNSQISWVETTVTGPGVLSWWWRASTEESFDPLIFSVANESVAGFEISGVTSWVYRTYTVTNIGSVNLRWEYSRDIAFGDGLNKAYLDQIKYKTGPEIPLSTALNTTNSIAIWTTGGNANPTYWDGQTNVSRVDGKAAESGAITTQQESWMETTVFGVTNLSFWWKVSSVTNAGRLKFYTNNVQMFQISGEVGWQLKTNLAISAGTNTLRWVCATDDLAIGKLNRGWVDEVALQPAPALPAALTNLLAVAGDAKATLTWSPSQGATSYQVNGSITNGGPYSIIASGLTTLSYTNTGLTNGTLYYYVVAANNFYGEGPGSTQVSARPVSLAPVSLGSAFNDGELQLVWPSDHTGWRLESQTNTLSVGLHTNWSPVAGSTVTNQVSVSVNASNGSVFFRLVSP